VNNILPPDIRVFSMQRVGKKFNPKTRCSSRVYYYMIPTRLFTPSKHYKGEKPSGEFKFDREKVNMVLKQYMGTNSFHNFTSKSGPTTAGDPRAMRYVINFTAGQAFTVDNEEWVQFTVVGQSFVLYQIRKMVGLAVAIIRDGATKNIINTCFEKPKKRLPIAPALGLFLCKCKFDRYNEHCKPHEPLTFKDDEAKMDSFKNDVILHNIIEKNKTENVFDKFLEELDTYPLNYERLLVTIETPEEAKGADSPRADLYCDEEEQNPKIDEDG